MENTLSPKNFFLQIGIIVALYASTISFLTFIFNIINTAFPDADIYSYNSYPDAIRYSISVLIVIFPLFLFLSRMHRKSMSGVEGKESKLRKWLLFLTLFLTGVAIAVDLIVLINTFLGGRDFTTSFILKVLAVLIVSGTIFYFYLKDIKGYWNENFSKAKTFSYVVSAVVILSVIGGFFVIGSPATQRMKLNDAQRINDLSTIQYQVVNFYQFKGKVPSSLNELTDPISGIIIPNDPETGNEYEYKVISNLSFELCATFTLSYNAKVDKMQVSTYYNNPIDENWNHEAGRACFTRTIDPEKNPRINNSAPVSKPLAPVPVYY